MLPNLAAAENVSSKIVAKRQARIKLSHCFEAHTMQQSLHVDAIAAIKKRLIPQMLSQPIITETSYHFDFQMPCIHHRRDGI